MPKALTGGKREDRLSKKHRAFLDGFDACIEMVDNFLSDPDGWDDLVNNYLMGDLSVAVRKSGMSYVCEVTAEQKSKFLLTIKNRLETRLNLRRNEISLDFLDKDNKSTL